jgi:hypothetical protein
MEPTSTLSPTFGPRERARNWSVVISVALPKAVWSITLNCSFAIISWSGPQSVATKPDPAVAKVAIVLVRGLELGLREVPRACGGR